jgi:predicted Rossmann fold nucleotide-binding protein DprA/Smf involved in DNA uptake
MWTGQDNSSHIKSKEADPILDILDNEALSADEVALKLNLPVAQVGARLSMLLLSGRLLEKAGKYYSSDVS